MRYRKVQNQARKPSLLRRAPGVVLGIAAVGAAGLFSASDLISSVAATGQNCDIKGNISMNSGERIYHVPGQDYYNATRVSLQHGERWFCLETEARKSRV